MLERREVRYSGHVQGVGFRYTAVHAARRWQVSGYVRNLSDGRVELVVEGESAEVDGFLADVARRMGDLIQDTQVSRAAATGAFKGFSIRF